MILPPLAEFILFIPASSAASDPSRWLEDCLVGGSEFLVLLDEHNAPIRALTLHHLLNLVDSLSTFPILHKHARAVGGSAVSAQNLLLPPYSLELGVINTTVPAITAARMVSAAPDSCWVAVNAHQQYQGLIDKTRLLAAAFAELSAGDAQGDSKQTTASEIRTSQSNTALLTYLGHELKTPLTSLLGLSSLLKIGGLGELNPRQHRYVGLIQQHCRRLANWVNTLIDLGRIESGALRLIPQMVDLATIWHEAQHQVLLRIGQEGLSPLPVPQILTAAPPMTLVADPNRLQQMLSCLMQTAMVAHSTSAETAVQLKATVWDEWLAFAIAGLDHSLSLDQLAQTTFTLPFPATPVPSTPISAEIGHWLEWLLVRKLAQYHRGELVLSVNEQAEICPTLILPKTPVSLSVRDSRFLLAVAPLNLDSLLTLRNQADQLNYRLLITQSMKDAIEIAAYLPLSAILVLIQPEANEGLEELRALRSGLEGSESLIVALVPAHQSASLGELPVDRELLWPTDCLGTVLLQPPPTVPAPSRLTILFLRSPGQTHAGGQKFPNIFHDFGCRVLEVDDLEQARLLRRVWKPDVAVLDPAIAVPAPYLQHLSEFPELSALPLITLTLTATQAAHDVPALTVFPCLVEEASWDTPEANERLATWLIQVLQVAATQTPPR